MYSKKNCKECSLETTKVGLTLQHLQESHNVELRCEIEETIKDELECYELQENIKYEYNMREPEQIRMYRLHKARILESC